MRSRDNLGGEVKVLSEVLETLVGEGVEVPLPAELGVDVATRREAVSGRRREDRVSFEPSIGH